MSRVSCASQMCGSSNQMEMDDVHCKLIFTVPGCFNWFAGIDAIFRIAHHWSNENMPDVLGPIPRFHSRGSSDACNVSAWRADLAGMDRSMSGL